MSFYSKVVFLGSMPPPQMSTLPPIPPAIFTTDFDIEGPMDFTFDEKLPLPEVQACDCSTVTNTGTTEVSSNTTPASMMTSTTTPRTTTPTTTTTTTTTTTAITTTTTIMTSLFNAKYCSKPENSVPVRKVWILQWFHSHKIINYDFFLTFSFFSWYFMVREPIITHNLWVILAIVGHDSQFLQSLKMKRVQVMRRGLNSALLRVRVPKITQEKWTFKPSSLFSPFCAVYSGNPPWYWIVVSGVHLKCRQFKNGFEKF